MCRCTTRHRGIRAWGQTGKIYHATSRACAVMMRNIRRKMPKPGFDTLQMVFGMDSLSICRVFLYHLFGQYCGTTALQFEYPSSNLVLHVVSQFTRIKQLIADSWEQLSNLEEDLPLCLLFSLVKGLVSVS